MRLVALLALPLLAGASPAEPTGGATIWYSMDAEDGARIGYASQQAVRGPQGKEITYLSHMRLQEMDNPSTVITDRTITRQDASGRPLTMETRSQIGRSWARVEARIGADNAQIIRSTSSGRRSVSIALPPRVRFDDGQGLLAAWNMAVAPRLEFDNFSLGAMAVEHVVLEAAPGAAPDSEGRTALLRKRYEGGELRAVATLLLDRRRRVVAVTQPMFGTTITTRATTRENALAPHPPYHVLRNVMVKSPFRIPDAALQGHIRYRFAFRQGLAFALPQTGEQRATAATGPGVILDICAGCGPGLAHDDAALADALKPTIWMQSDDPRLRAIAAPVARLDVSGARKMELLLERARPYLARIDFAGHYSALETLERRAGDCTEASVLLAALGRAAGIPTRVANGLAYSREQYHGVSNAFMPHSWTLAWVDGAWRSFDLALDRFDSSHIALTVGDGDARSVMTASQLASLLQWDGMTEVRAPPAG